MAISQKVNIYHTADYDIIGILDNLPPQQSEFLFRRIAEFPKKETFQGKSLHICIADAGMLPLLEACPPPPEAFLSFICIGIDAATVPPEMIFLHLPTDPPARTVACAIEKAALLLKSQSKRDEMEGLLKETARELSDLNQIGVALSAERDHGRLLDLILRKSMEVTSSDAGSLYLVEEVSADQRQLRFKHTRTNSLNGVPFKEFSMPIDDKSMAGYVALTGKPLNIKDAYTISPNLPFAHNKNFDQQYGYLTKSLLVLPMKNRQDEIIGVLQLINRKKDESIRLSSPEDFAESVIPYEPRQVELISSLASQAAVSIENNLLYQSIENLFEGFVRAAVLAIEQRDPPTSGHSERVAAMTCALAEAVSEIDDGPYADVKFTPEQLKELRYAGLLHDFGKVGVSEKVLVKSKKLYDHDLALIIKRFEFIRRTLEARFLEKKLNLLRADAQPDFEDKFELLDREYQEKLSELNKYLEAILKANEPTVMDEGSFEELIRISQETYDDIADNKQPLLTPEELIFLKVRKGTLTEKERDEIESHVAKSYSFLINIPWTKECSNVPEIARAHHEKINGEGYTLKLSGDEIPLPSKLMAVADIFDALTAADRPYKKAVPVEKALQILGFEVKDHHLDPELVRIFIEKEVYKAAQKVKPGKVKF